MSAMRVAFRGFARRGRHGELLFAVELDGGIYEASALVHPGGQPVFPHTLHASGESLGPVADAEVRAAAEDVLAVLEAAADYASWRRSRCARRRR